MAKGWTLGGGWDACSLPRLRHQLHQDPPTYSHLSARATTYTHSCDILAHAHSPCPGTSTISSQIPRHGTITCAASSCPTTTTVTQKTIRTSPACCAHTTQRKAVRSRNGCHPTPRRRSLCPRSSRLHRDASTVKPLQLAVVQAEDSVISGTLRNNSNSHKSHCHCAARQLVEAEVVHAHHTHTDEQAWATP